MNVDATLVKLVFLVLVQRLIAVAKQNSQRWIIREWFTQGELPFLQWFNLDFLLHLTSQQLLGLGIIATFTLITFPLGIWMGSFSLGKSFAVTNIIGTVVSLITFPISLNLMVNVLGELELNRITWTGIWLTVAGMLVIIVGCWLMYSGNNGGSV